jgi:putative addiction module killer protein
MELIKIVIYSTKTGKVPYSEWEDGLDKKINAIVKSRLDRIRLGNFGKVKTIKGSKDIWEIVLDVGPGYSNLLWYQRKNSDTFISRWRKEKPRARYRKSEKILT